MEYLERIGAEILHFRRGVIKQVVDRYHVEKTIVTVNKEGEVTVDNEELAPTPQEAHKIKEEFEKFFK